MIEVELKARLRDRAVVEARVASFAVPAGAVDKLDAYWHGPRWRSQRGTGGFRVRSESGRSVVTFKTKRSEGGIEINLEREFEVSEPEAFAELALRLGCEPFYTKRKLGLRFTARPSGSASDSGFGPATIEIIDVEGLGTFIEIELLLERDEPEAVALAQGELRGLLERAGVSESDIEPRFYSELLAEAGRLSRP